MNQNSVQMRLYDKFWNLELKRMIIQLIHKLNKSKYSTNMIDDRLRNRNTSNTNKNHKII